MCIIVDASKLGDFLNPKHEDSAPIRNWLNKGGKLIYSTCGKFAQEVGKGNQKKLKTYVQAGKADLIPCKEFMEEEQALKECALLKSNDPHILALARHTRTRLLYTGDPKLIKDFKNTQLIFPKGKVYSRANNADLLTKFACSRK